MLRTKRLLTYEDYARLPEDPRQELIEGELFVVPSPDLAHQSVLRNLGTHLWNFVKEYSLGVVFFAPFDVVLTPHDVVQPDLLYVARPHLERITEKHVQGAPDLVVEILSPGTRERDLLVKKGLYARCGVREYWIVDPGEKHLEVWTLVGERYQLHGIFFPEDSLESPLLPDFHPDLKEVFSF